MSRMTPGNTMERFRRPLDVNSNIGMKLLSEREREKPLLSITSLFLFRLRFV